MADLLVRAWRGPRPDVDGSWARVVPWRDGVHAVVAVTGRALVSAPDRVAAADLDAWGLDGFGGAHDPRVMTRLAGEGGWVDVLDAVLLAEGTGTREPWLLDRPDLRHQPRVQHALPIRGDVRVFGLEGDDETVLTMSTGIGGLPEVSFQVAPARRGAGLGTALARAAWSGTGRRAGRGLRLAGQRAEPAGAAGRRVRPGGVGAGLPPAAQGVLTREVGRAGMGGLFPQPVRGRIRPR